jgi:hypothetical protein
MRMRGSKGSKGSTFEPIFKGYMLVRHFIRCRRLISHNDALPLLVASAYPRDGVPDALHGPWLHLP